MTATQQQQAAINVPVQDNMAITAVPGAGKTFVIERRVDRLVQEGIDPANIAVITFSKAQAADMSRRIFSTFPYLAETELATGLGGTSQVMTIHAMCRRVLEHSYQDFPVTRLAANWQIRSIIEKWVERADWQYYDAHSKEMRPVGWHSIYYWIGRAKRDCVVWKTGDLQDFYFQHLPSDWIRDLVACSMYFQEALRNQPTRYGRGVWTFDDLLYETELRLKRDEDFRQYWHKRFTHILVDEAQDTNPQAMRIIKLIDPVVNMVGDEDQAIYRFQGATPDINLREGFDEMFGGERVKMSINFRSHPVILKRAQKLITYNYDEDTQIYSKTLEAREECGPGPDLTWRWFVDAEEEAREIVRDITYALKDDKQNGDFFIMTRTNAQLAHFELEFLQRGIPFVNLGVSSFFSRKIPGIVISYMQLAVDPRNWKAYDRIYNIASQYMSNRQGQYIQTRYLGNEFNNKLNRSRFVLDELAAHQYDKNRKGWAGWANGAGDLISTLQAFSVFSEEDSAGAFAEAVVDRVLRKWMEVEYPVEVDGSESAYEDLAVIREMADRFTIAQFLKYVEQLQSSKDVKPEDLVEYVLIGTVYRFKGLERPVVYLAGMSEGLLPHRFSLGDKIPTDGVPLPRTSTVWDERNLAYVGVTRAIHECHLSGIASWPTIKKELLPSRFVAEMELLDD